MENINKRHYRTKDKTISPSPKQNPEMEEILKTIKMQCT